MKPAQQRASLFRPADAACLLHSIKSQGRHRAGHQIRGGVDKRTRTSRAMAIALCDQPSPDSRKARGLFTQRKLDSLGRNSRAARLISGRLASAATSSANPVGSRSSIHAGIAQWQSSSPVRSGSRVQIHAVGSSCLTFTPRHPTASGVQRRLPARELPSTPSRHGVLSSSSSV